MDRALWTDFHWDEAKKIKNGQLKKLRFSTPSIFFRKNLFGPSSFLLILQIFYKKNYSNISFQVYWKNYKHAQLKRKYRDTFILAVLHFKEPRLQNMVGPKHFAI